MDFLKSVTGKVVGGLVALGVIVAAISWWQMDPTTRQMLLAGTGRILAWLGIVLALPWVTIFIIRAVAQRDSNLAGAMLVLTYSVIEFVLLVWLFHWHMPNLTAWIFLIASGLFAVVYNLFTCDWLAEKVA